MKDASGDWMPNLSEKQVRVFNNRKRALLVPGPRLSGKTRAVLHRIARHLWEVDGARVGMFSRIMKDSKDSGAWRLMTRNIIGEWIDARIGMRYTTDVKGIPGPKIDGTTRTPFFKVTNSHGTESEMQLFSLDNDDAAEIKLKESEFSMIYFSELDKFGTPKVLTVGLPSLRMAGVPYEDQMWIGDCNPSEDGPDSWIYQTFYVERGMTYDQFVERQKSLDIPPMTEEKFRAFYGSLDVIEILPQDNPFVDARQLQEVEVACGTDQGLYARHVLGKWIWGGGDRSRHFRSIVSKNVHIVGTAHQKDPESEWEGLILPSTNCFEIGTGWDLGEVNHAVVAGEKLLVPKWVLNPKTHVSEPTWEPHFTVLDEIVSIGHEISVSDFTLMVMEKLLALEVLAAREIDFSDHAWSDKSSIEKYVAAADSFQHLIVNAASGNRISLRGVPKVAGSVLVRIKLLKDLLRTKRLHVSAHCFEVIKMLRDLKKGKDTPIPPDDPNRHVFDALTYWLLMECREELLLGNSLPTGVRKSLEVHV